MSTSGAQRGWPGETSGVLDAPRGRRAVLTVAFPNFGYFLVEFFVALGWALPKRAVMGKVMAVVILVPASFAAWTGSGWPDLVLGCLITPLALYAAYEVWEVSEEERLAAKALAGEEID